MKELNNYLPSLPFHHNHSPRSFEKKILKEVKSGKSGEQWLVEYFFGFQFTGNGIGPIMTIHMLAILHSLVALDSASVFYECDIEVLHPSWRIIPYLETYCGLFPGSKSVCMKLMAAHILKFPVQGSAWEKNSIISYISAWIRGFPHGIAGIRKSFLPNEGNDRFGDIKFAFSSLPTEELYF